jgi:hypothetical protein
VLIYSAADSPLLTIGHWEHIAMNLVRPCMVFPPCGDEQSSLVDLLSGEGSTPLPRRGSAAVYLEDLASGVEQSNLIDMLSGKALRRLPRRGSAAVYLEDLASGVEQSNLIDVLSGEGSAPTPAKNSAAVYSEDLARRGTPEGESLPYSSLPYSHPS